MIVSRCTGNHPVGGEVKVGFEVLKKLINCIQDCTASTQNLKNVVDFNIKVNFQFKFLPSPETMATSWSRTRKLAMPNVAI